MQKIYGKHAIVEALKNKERVLKELHVRDNDLLAYVPKHVPVHQGAKEDCLVAQRLPFKAIEDIDSDHVLMLDEVTDPQNLGAIIRSCACFGFRYIVLRDYKDLLKSEVVVRVASGGYEHVSLVPVTNITQSIKFLQKSGYWCYGLAEEGEPFTKKIEGKCVLVIGAEGKGLRDLTKKSCDACLKIPTSSAFSTLNASHAATVAMAMVSVV